MRGAWSDSQIYLSSLVYTIVSAVARNLLHALIWLEKYPVPPSGAGIGFPPPASVAERSRPNAMVHGQYALLVHTAGVNALSFRRVSQRVQGKWYWSRKSKDYYPSSPDRIAKIILEFIAIYAH